MNKLLKTLTITATALALAASVHAGVEIGKAAPDFTLKDSNGNARSLSEFAGKVVVLEWVNHGCPFVQKHYNSKNMQALQAKYTAKEVVWLTICSSAPGQQGHETPAKWNEVNAAKGYAGSALLIDEPGKVGRLYGAKTTPHMFVVATDGTLAYNGAIDSIKSSNPSDIAKAQNYVAAAIDEIVAGKAVTTATSAPYGCGIKYASDS
jgi:peroxiredoxin